VTQGRGNAYVGPQPVPPDRHLYGRQRELLALTNRLLSERLVLLYSPSGAGKTSLIQARGGLRDRLAAEGFRLPPVLRVGRAADVAARAGVNRYLLSTLAALEPARPVEELAALLRPGADGPGGDFLDRHLAALPGAGEGAAQVFLVFDQFEELLTLDPTDDAGRREFLRQLGAALKDGDRWALFAMREDYVAALDPYLPLLPTRLSATFRLDLLGKAAAGDAIRRPAAEFGTTVEDAVVDKLLSELARTQVQNPLDGRPREKEGNAVEPLHLQVVCQRLWRERAEPGRVTPADLDRLAEGRGDGLRGVSAALAHYYNEAVGQVAARFAGQGVSERAVRNWFGRALISPDGLRLPVLLGSEQAYGLSPEVLQALADRYLIRSDRRLGGVWYELAHDRLAEPVLRSNAAWRKEKLPPFQQAAELWREGGERDDLLVTGEVLAEGERQEAEAPGQLSPDDRRFRTRCREVRRQRKVRGWLVVTTGASILGVVLLAGLGTAWYFREQATRQEVYAAKANRNAASAGAEADRQRQLARTQQKTSDGLKELQKAQQSLDDNPSASVRPARLAAEIFLELGQPELLEQSTKVLRVAIGNRGMRRVQTTFNPISDLFVDPKGEWLVIRTVNGLALASGNPLSTAYKMPGGRGSDGIVKAAITPDQDFLLTGNYQGKVSLRPLRGRAPEAEDVVTETLLEAGANNAVTALDVARSHDGAQTAAVGFQDGTVTLVDLREKTKIRSWQAARPGEPITNVLFSPLPKRLLTSGVGGEIKSWDISRPLRFWNRRPEPDSIVVGSNVTKIAINPSATYLAVGTAGGSVDVFGMDPSDKSVPDPRKPLAHKDVPPELVWRLGAPVNLLVFGQSDGIVRDTWLLAGHANFVNVLYSPRDGSLRYVNAINNRTRLIQTPITAAAASDDGRWLATGLADGNVQMWRVDILFRAPGLLAAPDYTLSGPRSAVSVCCVSRINGTRWLFTGSMDGTVRRWDLSLYEKEPGLREQLQHEGPEQLIQRAKDLQPD
jgi:WD40 repeat protein